MLTIKEAAQIGIDACIDKIGRDFVLANCESGTFAYGENDGSVYCYVGVDDQPSASRSSDTLALDNTSEFPYHTSCNVCLADGATTFIECVRPA